MQNNTYFNTNSSLYNHDRKTVTESNQFDVENIQQNQDSLAQNNTFLGSKNNFQEEAKISAYWQKAQYNVNNFQTNNIKRFVGKDITNLQNGEYIYKSFFNPKKIQAHLRNSSSIQFNRNLLQNSISMNQKTNGDTSSFCSNFQDKNCSNFQEKQFLTENSDKYSNKENQPPLFQIENLQICENKNLQFCGKENIQCVPQYVHKIIDHLRLTEHLTHPLPSYFTHQTDINEKMRSILLDWLIDVHMKFKLLPDTLFITVNIIDRFLEKYQIQRTKLQLVGVCALFIACKYEEVYAVPHIRDLVYVCDKAYTKEEILLMEGTIMQQLDFNLLSVSPLRFLEYYGKIAQLEEKNLMLSRYLIEMALLDFNMLKYIPSILVCASIYLVHKIRKNQVAWPIEQMVQVTKYSEQQIRPCAKELCALLQTVDKRSTFKCLKKKFSQLQYFEVAKIRIEKKNSTQPGNIQIGKEKTMEDQNQE